MPAVRLWPLPLAAAALLAGAAPAPLPEAALEMRTEGLALLENERPADAEAVFRRLAELVPADPLPAADLAVALLRQQKYDEALAAAEAALALAPKSGEVLAIRAEVLQWSGKPEEALAAYKAAAAAAPEDLEVVYGLYRQATTLQGESAARNARLALAQLARLRPENLVVLLRLGAEAIAGGDRTAASGAYLRVRELLWQAPPIAADTLAKLLDALEAGDLAAARVPSLRLENVLKITPAFQQGQRELTTGVLGSPLTRFAAEPPPVAFGKPLAVSFTAERLDSTATAGGALVAADLDGDQLPDLARLIAGGPPRLEVRRAAEGWKAPAATLPAPAGAAELLAADLDNDGHLDLLAFGGKGLALFRGRGDGTFEDATASFGLAGAAGATAAEALDFDIEGDLDLFTAGAGSPELWRNDLAGPLTAVGAQAFPRLRLASPRAAVASDLDRDGDLDLVIAGDGGLVWLDNLRQGKFQDRTAAAGLDRAVGARALVSADLDGDGLPDLAAAGAEGLALWHNLGGRFAPWQPPPPRPAAGALSRLVAFDADNDGRLDLAAAGDGGLAVLTRSESGGFTAAPVEGIGGPVTALAAADLDGDGDLDLVAGGPGGLFRLTNRGGEKNHWLAVRLRGLTTGNGKNNVFGRGATLEVRAGRAYQFREAASDVVHFGLGSLAQPQALRVVWTNGVPQDRLAPKGDETVVEEQVLKGSCPFLYAWDGRRMAFVTDLLWGAPLGLPVGPGKWAAADPRELVAVPGAQPREGSYRLAVTEELWEAAFFDQVRLWVVDHPAAVEVASSLKILPGETVPEEVLGARRVRPVAAAWDGRGRQVTARVARRDDVYADGYPPSPYQGVSPAWSFTFDLGAAPGRPIRLLLDGWIFPADASLNLAVAQRPDLPYLPPRLEVETAGGWRTLMPAMGHPAGKTKTMVVDTPALPAGARRLRITTSLWLSWDRIAWTDEADDAAPRVVARLAPARADLAYRGFSALVRKAPNAPHSYLYSRLERASPWLPFPGRYTRYGEVGELLAAADDRMVILAPGDRLALAFDASALPPPPPGWERSVFLESFGWDKDADRNTYRAGGVEPLPFGAMSGYPYGPGETYPDTPALRAYRRDWLTRQVH
jgi:tetratricopeptide (TPR) repeat protein